MLTRAAWGSSEEPAYWSVTGVATNEVLKVRAAPGSRTKVGEIPPHGHGLRNLGCQGKPAFGRAEKMSAAERARADKRRWCKVRYGAIEGWVASQFLAADPHPPSE